MVSQLQDYDIVSKIIVYVFVVGWRGAGGAGMTEAVLCIVGGLVASLVSPHRMSVEHS